MEYGKSWSSEANESQYSMNGSKKYSNKGELSIMTKGAIAGATIATFVTLLIQVLVMSFAHGESSISWLLMWPYIAVIWPARHLCQVIGQAWPLGGNYILWKSLVLMVLINSLLVAFVGVIVAWLAYFARNKGKNKTE